jgi:quercetin dioxygenase-like cupin family protein
MDEAKLVDRDEGKAPEGEGWFVLNLRDASWETLERGGTWVAFEAEGVPNQIGVGAHVLPEGHSTGFYHREGNQEGFLVLEGQCLVIVEGQERVLRRWDYFHCPPGTGHVMVGGEGGCALFMFGNRLPDATTDYLPDPVAAKHGVAVREHTTSSKEAYADWPRDFARVRSPWPPPAAA